MSFFGLFGGGEDRNPSDAAMPYLNQIPGVVHGAYDPYINKGNQAYGVYNPILENMTKDPAAYINSLMGQYAPSKGFQLKRDDALKAAGAAAAAGGMRGSMQDINNQAGLSDRLMDQDMQEWLSNVMNMQGMGLQGEQHLFDTGYNASGNMAGDISNALGQQGQYAFQGQRELNQRNADRDSGFMKMLGGVAGFAAPMVFGKHGLDWM